MVQTTVKVGGMQCGMCESHVNDAVRRAFRVKKVTSSHAKGETVILSEEVIDGEQLRKVISGTGYDVGAISQAPYEKKGLFSGFRK